MFVLLVIHFCFGLLIIDHTSVEKIDEVCDDVLNATYYDIFLHYAHTSHGGQIYEGSDSYLITGNPRYQMWQYSYILPTELPEMYYPPGLRFFDGQDGLDYVTPEDYWASAAGLDLTRETLDTGLFTHSMFAFCGQFADNEGPSYATSYTTQMALLEEEYPGVTFIYMTGHLAGSSEYDYSDSERENVRQNNEHVRDFVTANDKVLYDFADIESYYEDSECLTNSNGLDNYNNYPVECDWPSSPDSFYCAHTVGYNCMKKAKAFWYMLASLVVEDPIEVTCVVEYDFPPDEDDDIDDDDDDDGVGVLGISFLLV